MKKLISLLLALALLVSCAFCEEGTEAATEEASEAAAETAAEETVDPSTVALMTIGDQTIYLDQVQDYTERLYENSYIESADDLLSGLEYVIRYVTGMKLLVSDPSQWLDADTIASVTTESGEYYDECVQSYVDYYAAEDATEDDKAALALEAAEYYGITRDEYIQDSLTAEAYDAMLASYDVTVTDEDIEAAYNEEAEYEINSLAEAAAYYGVSEVYLYEYYTNYYGYSFYFMPEGYRGVLHILLTADDDLLTAYTSAETEEDKAAAAEAIVASKQDTIDAIYAAFNAGTPFTDLIAQYNEDPGMEDETTLAEGYSVNAESSTFVSEFTEGAFSDKMQQPGDISDPIVSEYGVHIMYYLRDIPGGALPMTDEVKETISNYVLSQKQSECADEALKAFEKTYTDAYAQYIGEENFLDK